MAHRVCLVVLLAVVAVAGLFQVHNRDIYLHARTGQWIVDHGAVPHTNVLSRAWGDYPTVDDKWGFQVLTHVLLDRLGVGAVITARMVLLLVLFGLLADTARRLGASPWSWLLLLLLALVAARSRFLFRPGLASLVLLAVFVRAALAIRPDGRRLGWLVLLQVVWVNLHGFFILGPLVMATVGTAHLASGRAGWPAARRFVGLALALALACLINPAFVDGALHPLHILADLRAHYDLYSTSILEFRPTFASDPRQPLDRIAFVVLALPALGLLAWRALPRLLGGRDGARLTEPAGDEAPAPIELPALALALVFGLATLSLRRNMALFAVTVAPLAAAVWTRWGHLQLRGAWLPGALALALAAGEMTDFTSIHDGLDRRWGPGLSALAYPEHGIAFIAEHFPEAEVFTGLSYGSTLTGRRWPQQAASTDGNTHGYPTAHLEELMSVLSGEDPRAFGRVADRDGYDLALVPLAGVLSAKLMHDRDWALVLLGIHEALYVRRSAMDTDWLARHDMERDLKRGGLPDMPDTPPRKSVLGFPRTWVPLAELDQAVLLGGAGYDQVALQRARRAVELAPEHAESLALCGLFTARLGQADEARALLQRSLEAGGYNRLREQAQKVLRRL